MVKKTSILEKLVNRWRPASGISVDKDIGRESNGGVRRVDIAAALPAERMPEAVSGRKLSPKEEAVMAMGEGFEEELSNLVRGLQVRVEDQGSHVAGIDHHIQQLPALQQAQLEVLHGLALQLEKQGTVGDAMLRTFGEMPEVLKGVKEALERSAATDERTAKTLGEFRSTMDRIQGAIGDMVDHSKIHAEAAWSLSREHRASTEQIVDTLGQVQVKEAAAMRSLVEGVGSSQREAMQRLHTTTEGSMMTLRRAQEDQANRLGKLVADSGKWNRAVLVLLVLSFTALACIFGALLLK